MCGEHQFRCNAVTSDSGSSPHVRGAPVIMTEQESMRGIIPACAGSTEVRSGHKHHDGDHPRMCGEHRNALQSATSSTGSSPHVRGALSPPVFLRVRPGIIPACAGSTPKRLNTSTRTRDHPRMCGEHHSGACGNSHTLGSSPHVRGAQGWN